MPKELDRTQIIVAVIGLLGVLSAALIANWHTLFQPDDTGTKSKTGVPSATLSPPEAPPVTSSNDAGNTPPPSKGNLNLSDVKQQVASLEQTGLAALAERRLAEADIALQQAEELLANALQHAPNDTNLLNLNGYLHKNWAMQYQRLSMQKQSEEQLIEAERAFKLVLDLNNKDPGALNGMGSVSLLRGDLKAAESYIRQALAVLPNYPAAQDDLAVIEKLKAQQNKAP